MENAHDQRLPMVIQCVMGGVRVKARWDQWQGCDGVLKQPKGRYPWAVVFQVSLFTKAILVSIEQVLQLKLRICVVFCGGYYA